jgi:hypothetical protein
MRGKLCAACVGLVWGNRGASNWIDGWLELAHFVSRNKHRCTPFIVRSQKEKKGERVNGSSVRARFASLGSLAAVEKIACLGLSRN